MVGKQNKTSLPPQGEEKFVVMPLTKEASIWECFVSAVANCFAFYFA